jgi:hypothetical protein
MKPRLWLLLLTSFVLLARAADPVSPRGLTALSRTNLLAYADKAGAIHPVKTKRDWEKRRAAILEAVQGIMGPLPGLEKRCPLDVRVEEEVDCGTYVRRFLSYASEPRSRVPAYLLIPKDVLAGKRKATGILTLHQTHKLGQKVVVGLGESPNDEYGVELARRGYVCLAPAYPLLANYAPDWRALGYQSASMKAIWDNVRGLDLLESLPYVRRGKFGTIGHSLGGHNSVFTALFDTRIQAVASSCGLDAFRDYMNGNIKGWTGDRYMPRLTPFLGRLSDLPFDFDELIGALAPRPVFISAPVGDTNFKWRSVDDLAANARPIYSLYKKSGALVVEHPDCAHLFPKAMREQAYRMFDDQLK